MEEDDSSAFIQQITESAPRTERASRRNPHGEVQQRFLDVHQNVFADDFLSMHERQRPSKKRFFWLLLLYISAALFFLLGVLCIAVGAVSPLRSLIKVCTNCYILQTSFVVLGCILILFSLLATCFVRTVNKWLGIIYSFVSIVLLILVLMVFIGACIIHSRLLDYQLKKSWKNAVEKHSLVICEIQEVLHCSGFSDGCCNPGNASVFFMPKSQEELLEKSINSSQTDNAVLGNDNLTNLNDSLLFENNERNSNKLKSAKDGHGLENTTSNGGFLAEPTPNSNSAPLTTSKVDHVNKIKKQANKAVRDFSFLMLKQAIHRFASRQWGTSSSDPQDQTPDPSNSDPQDQTPDPSNSDPQDQTPDPSVNRRECYNAGRVPKWVVDVCASGCQKSNTHNKKCDDVMHEKFSAYFPYATITLLSLIFLLLAQPFFSYKYIKSS